MGRLEVAGFQQRLAEQEVNGTGLVGALERRPQMLGRCLRATGGGQRPAELEAGPGVGGVQRDGLL